ncbi:FxsA family protein [Corynebacterium sp. 76QC2CO]|nr:FxsA family protein [Corynebacterium sp. 76QC2CO]
MPILVALPYILIEALAFWGVASWLGVGTALLLLLGFFFGGLIFAAWEMSRISRRLMQGNNPGKAAGDLGLTAAGAILIAMPGFCTSIFGLLLVLTPTRALLRKVLARKLALKIEQLGVRSYEQAAAFRPTTSTYGSFGSGTGSGSGVMLGEDGKVFIPGDAGPGDNGANGATPRPDSDPNFEAAIEAWSATMKPEDFTVNPPKDGGSGEGGSGDVGSAGGSGDVGSAGGSGDSGSSSDGEDGTNPGQRPKP